MGFTKEYDGVGTKTTNQPTTRDHASKPEYERLMSESFILLVALRSKSVADGANTMKREGVANAVFGAGMDLLS